MAKKQGGANERQKEKKWEEDNGKGYLVIS